MAHGQNQAPTQKQSNSVPTSNWTFPAAPPYMPGALPFLFLFFSQHRANKNSQKATDQAPSSCVLF